MTTSKYNSEEYIGEKYGRLTVLRAIHHTQEWRDAVVLGNDM